MKTGAKHSEETLAKMRGPRGPMRYPSPRKGIPLSDETRAKMSASRTGHTTSPETRKKIGAANRGRTRTSTQRAAMSITHKAAGNRADTVEKHRAARKQWWADITDEKRAQLVAARREGQSARWAKVSAEDRRRLMAPAVAASIPVTRASWAALSADDKAVKLSAVWKASQQANPSSLELSVARLLDALGVSYECQVRLGRYMVDFLVRERRLVIECDGSYWHGLPGRADKDAVRDEWLRASGYDVLRLPEVDIRSGVVADVLAKVAG